MKGYVAFIGACCCLLVSCSGLKTYRSDYRKNLIISTETDSGFWSGVDASLDIYRMSGECDVHYQGTVELGDSRVEVGIPAGLPAYLVFNFASSAFLANSRSHMNYDVVLSPVDGYVYDVDVTYRDDIYNVEVQERMPGASVGQEMVVGTRDADCSAMS